MSYDEDKVDEAALALMHLVKHRHRKGGPLRAWKGLDWDILDRLHEKGYISDPKSKAKSVKLSEEGVERSAELFEAFFVDTDSEDLEASDRADGQAGDAEEQDRVIDPRWRDREWSPPSDDVELTALELTDMQLARLRNGLSDDPDTVFFDLETGDVDSFYEPGLDQDLGLFPDEEEELRREARQRRDELESDDRYVIIPKEETQEAWQRMRDFIDFVVEDSFAELLDNSIRGKGAFGRFRDAITHRAGVRDLWFEYSAFRREMRIRDLLAAEGYRIVIVEEDGETSGG